MTVHDVETGATLFAFSTEKPIIRCCISGDGQSYATCHKADEDDILFKVFRKGMALMEFRHPLKNVTDIRFTADVMSLTVVYDDEHVDRFTLPTDGSEVRREDDVCVTFATPSCEETLYLDNAGITPDGGTLVTVEDIEEPKGFG